MAVILLRHTTPDVAPGTCYGRTDLALAASFDAETQRVRESLPGGVAHLVSSPLGRCRRLAERLGIELGLAPEIDPRLIELDFGAWEMRPWAEIPRPELDAWRDDFLHANPHGGETVAMLKARVDAAVADLRRRDGPVLAVTHSGVIKAALAQGAAAEHFSATVGFGQFLNL